MSGLPKPDFLSGYLPPGIHPSSPEELKNCYVPSRGVGDWGSEHRESLFSGYLQLIEALKLVGLPADQWIGGSFISKTEKPKDIDLVNYCDVAAYQALPPALRAMIHQYFQGEETAKRCHCDSYFVPLPPQEHRLKKDFLTVMAYWEKELGHDKAGRKKGIVSCHINTPSQIDVIETLDAAAT